MHGVVGEALRRLALREELRGGWVELEPEHRVSLVAAAQNAVKWEIFLEDKKHWTFVVRRELSERLIDWIPRLDEVFESDFLTEADDEVVEPISQLDFSVLDSDEEKVESPNGTKSSATSRKREGPGGLLPELSPSKKQKLEQADNEPINDMKPEDNAETDGKPIPNAEAACGVREELLQSANLSANGVITLNGKKAENEEIPAVSNVASQERVVNSEEQPMPTDMRTSEAEEKGGTQEKTKAMEVDRPEPAEKTEPSNSSTLEAEMQSGTLPEANLGNANAAQTSIEPQEEVAAAPSDVDKAKEALEQKANTLVAGLGTDQKADDKVVTSEATAMETTGEAHMASPAKVSEKPTSVPPMDTSTENTKKPDDDGAGKTEAQAKTASAVAETMEMGDGSQDKGASEETQLLVSHSGDDETGNKLKTSTPDPAQPVAESKSLSEIPLNGEEASSVQPELRENSEDPNSLKLNGGSAPTEEKENSASAPNESANGGSTGEGQPSTKQDDGNQEQSQVKELDVAQQQSTTASQAVEENHKDQTDSGEAMGGEKLETDGQPTAVVGADPEKGENEMLKGDVKIAAEKAPEAEPAVGGEEITTGAATAELKEPGDPDTTKKTTEQVEPTKADETAKTVGNAGTDNTTKVEEIPQEQTGALAVTKNAAGALATEDKQKEKDPTLTSEDKKAEVLEGPKKDEVATADATNQKEQNAMALQAANLGVDTEEAKLDQPAKPGGVQAPEAKADGEPATVGKTEPMEVVNDSSASLPRAAPQGDSNLPDPNSSSDPPGPPPSSAVSVEPMEVDNVEVSSKGQGASDNKVEVNENPTPVKPEIPSAVAAGPLVTAEKVPAISQPALPDAHATTEQPPASTVRGSPQPATDRDADSVATRPLEASQTPMEVGANKNAPILSSNAPAPMILEVPSADPSMQVVPKEEAAGSTPAETKVEQIASEGPTPMDVEDEQSKAVREGKLKQRINVAVEKYRSTALRDQATEPLLTLVLEVCKAMCELSDTILAPKAKDGMHEIENVMSECSPVRSESEILLRTVLSKYNLGSCSSMVLLPADVKRVFLRISPAYRSSNLKMVAQRRAKRKQLRDNFLSQCGASKDVQLEDRNALLRTPQRTATSIQDDMDDEASLPEYQDLSSGILRCPRMPPCAETETVTARITDLLLANGPVQRNVTNMDRLRTIRARKKQVSPRPRQELIITNHDCYLNGSIIGDDYAKELMSRSIAVVLAHGGFTQATRSTLDVLTHITEEFLDRIGRSLILNRSHNGEQESVKALPGKKVAKNGKVLRDKVLTITRSVTSGNFRGGFAELAAYREQEIMHVTHALREAEMKVKRKIPEWQQYLAARESPKARLEGYSGQIDEMERIFGLFPDGVALDILGEGKSLVPRSLAEKVIKQAQAQVTQQ